MKITIQTLQMLKQKPQAITVLTAYDATMARVMNDAGLDVILIGDSLGNVIQGEATTLPVTLEDMLYHTRCVAKGNRDCFLISDLPFMSYARPKQALTNAAKLMQAGTMMVKMEGGAWLAPTIQQLQERGIPVCAHLGLLPQSVHKLSGFKIQAKDAISAQRLLEEAKLLEQAGAQLLVLECVPAALAAEVSRALTIPVIGIGAGQGTDGQVLVLQDLLGLSAYLPQFAKNFLAETKTESPSIKAAIEAYCAAVRNRNFPEEK